MYTEVWLRGPIDDVPALLMPAAHAFLQAKEEFVTGLGVLSQEQLHARPGGVASIAWHIRHLAGSTDRLLTYARGETLSPVQRSALEAEKTDDAALDAAALAEIIGQAMEHALSQLKRTDPEVLLEPRMVGSRGLPSTVIGLLFHAAEHAARHTGQATTTAKQLLLGGGAPS